MADFDGSLPIAMTDYTDPEGVDKQVEVSEKLVHMRAYGEDPANTKVQVKLSEEGRVNPNGDYDVTVNTKPGSVGMIAHDRNASPSEATQNLRPTAVVGASDSTCLDISLHDETGQIYSSSNPLPVSIEQSEGSEIHDYNTSASVESGGTVNHDYTVTASTLLNLEQVWASASSKMKVELQVEDGVGAGTFTSYAVGFNSVANPNVDLMLKRSLNVAAGVIVRIILQNRDNQVQDLYSTLVGVEVAV